MLAMNGDRASVVRTTTRMNLGLPSDQEIPKPSSRVAVDGDAGGPISPASVRTTPTEAEGHKFNSMFLLRKESSSPEQDESPNQDIAATNPINVPPTLPPLPPKQSPIHRTLGEQRSPSQPLGKNAHRPEKRERNHKDEVPKSGSLSPTSSIDKEDKPNSLGEQRARRHTYSNDWSPSTPPIRKKSTQRTCQIVKSSSSFDEMKQNWNRANPPPPLRPPMRRRSASLDIRQEGFDVKTNPSDEPPVRRAKDTVYPSKSDLTVTRWTSLEPSILSSPKKQSNLTPRKHTSSSHQESEKTDMANAINQKPCLKSSFQRAILDTSDEYKRHGVIQYMRPDGFDLVNARKYSVAQPQSSSAQLTRKTRSRDLDSFNKLLQSIAKSNFEDRANRAGQVLKRMKESLVEPDATTRRLLAECSRVQQSPVLPKIHDVNLKVETVEEIVIEKGTNAHIKVIKKKVRFAPTISTCIIRRRRSISSMERWDDPLTPPKRVMTTLNLIAGRFTAGIHSDDTPAIPRRSGSVCSEVTGSSSESLGSTGSECSPESSSAGSQEHTFQLPLTPTSPLTITRKMPIGLMRDRRPQDGSKRESLTQMGYVLLTPTERQVESPPIAPVRKRNKDSPTNSPEQEEDSAKLNIVLRKRVDKEPKHTMDYRSDPLSTPPQSRLTLARRYSIGSNMERRMPAPLTPPRRVSEPLAIFIAQNSLRTNKRNDTPIPPKKDMVNAPVRETPPKPERKRYKLPPSSEKIDRQTSIPRPPRKSFDYADLDNDSIHSHVSNVERHENSIAENWTKIHLPRRSSLTTSLSATSSEHSMRSMTLAGAHNAGQATRSPSPPRRASARSDQSVASVDSEKLPSSPWKCVNPIKTASERLSAVPRQRKTGPREAPPPRHKSDPSASRRRRRARHVSDDEG